jgi:hypothetical protein
MAIVGLAALAVTLSAPRLEFVEGAGKERFRFKEGVRESPKSLEVVENLAV